MSAVAADYTSTLAALQRCLRFGTHLTDAEVKTAIQVVRDGASKYSTLKTHVGTQCDILDAFTAGSAAATIVAAIATASTALRADVSVAAASLVTNSALDG